MGFFRYLRIFFFFLSFLAFFLRACGMKGQDTKGGKFFVSYSDVIGCIYEEAKEREREEWE
jgi:hypothetical protein